MASKYDGLIDEVTDNTPPPASPALDTYGALIDEVTSSAPLHNSLFSASGTNPDQEARKRQLAKDLGTEPGILPADAEEQAKLKKLDADVIQQTAPKTAKFLTNEDNAKLTGLDGVEKLANMERAYKTYSPTNVKKFIENYTSTGKTAAEAAQRLTQMKAQGINLADELDPYAREKADIVKDPLKAVAQGTNLMGAGFMEAARQAEIVPKLVDLIFPAYGKIRRETNASVQQQLNEGADYWQGEKSQGLQKLNKEFEKAGIADSVMMLLANPELTVDQLSVSVPYMAPGAVAARGGAVAMSGYNAFIEASDAANTARQEAIKNGQSLEQQDRSAMIAAVTTAPLAFLGNKLTGTAAFEADFFTKGSTGQKLLDAVVKEAISGAIEEGSNQLGVNIGAAQYDDNRQILEGVGKAMVVGGLLESTHAVGMTTAERALRTFIKDTENVTNLVAESNKNAAQAVAAHDTIEQLSAMTADNELRTRAPEAFQEFIETMTEGEELQEVYVDGATVLATIQDNYTDLIRTQPELFARIQEAASLGHDVQFTVGEYLTYFAGNPIEKTVLPMLKSEPGGATYQEAQEFYNKQAELFQSEVQAVAAQNEPVLSREEFEAMNAPAQTEVADIGMGQKRYTTPDGAQVTVMEGATAAPRENSITGFEVPENNRGKGVGTKLLRTVLANYDKATVSAAVSSEPSLKAFYKEGFRPLAKTDATFEEALAMMQADSSVTVVFPGVDTKAPTQTYEEYVARHNNKREVYAKDVEAVETTLFNEMQKAGRFTSSVNRAYVVPLVEFYKTQAKNFGVSPSEMYAKYPLKVQAFLGLLPSGNELNQDTPAVLDDFRKGNVANLLSKGNWVIMTPENPKAVRTPELNPGFVKKFEEQLKAEGIEYYPVDGKYGYEEKSFILFNTTPEQGLALGRQYDQESVLTRDGLIYQDGSRNPSLGKVTEHSKAPDDFYTTVVFPDGAQNLFTVEVDFDTKLQAGEVRPLTPEMVGSLDQTKTEAFKKWFGDSKVVDENGEPLVVYHGTPEDIESFNTNGETSGKSYDKGPEAYPGGIGAWFTTAFETASHFAREQGVEKYRVGGQEIPYVWHPLQGVPDQTVSGATLYPVYLSIKRPKLFRSYTAYEKAIKRAGGVDEYKRQLRLEGFDGLVFKGISTDSGEVRDDWVAFEPTQIKSAIGNIGTFDPANPSIVNQGAAKVGQVSIRGVHYSKEQRATLNGGYYGTGIKGAEGERVRGAKDSRIKQRLYFYVDEGKGVFPEYGVGNFKHVVDLPNMYDGARNPLKLPTRNADGERDMNVFESAVIDAGFDGYYIESAFGRQGAAVLLGDASKSVKPLTEAVMNQSVAVRRGTETLKRFGLDPNKTYSTREVAAALEARQRKKFGKIDDKDTSPEASKRIASWMVEEVLFEMENRDSSAIGWYSTKFQEAIDILAQDNAPELLTDPNARALLTALVAITSDGQKVISNMAQAMEIYKSFFKTDELKPMRGHNRQASVDGNLAALQDLFELLGPEEVHDFLLQEKTVKELGAIAKDKGITFNANYAPDTKLPMAAVIFGPKLGAFYANLMGKEGYLTMDRWWVRTFNRYRGTLLTRATPSSLAKFRELLGKPDLSDDETIAIASTYEARYKASGYKAKTELNKLGNTIHRATFGVVDKPARTSDRTFMIETARRAKEMLARKGIDMSIADIQATLWYYEKRLYGELGARDSANISYADAARRIVALDGGYSVLSEGDVETLGDRLSLGEELYQTGVNQTDTAEFRNWFGGSEIINPDGTPKIMYHGTKKDFDAFDTGFRGAIFVTPDPDFANEFTGMDDKFGFAANGTPNVMPVYVSANNVFTPSNPEHIALVREYLRGKQYFNEVYTLDELVQAEERGVSTWAMTETPRIRKAIQDLGFDGFYVREGGVDNLAVFEPEQLKSAVGNNGNFDPNNPSVVEQGTRGSFNLDTLIMTLMQGADLSTVIHESGHFYLKMLETLANRTDAPQEVKDDYQKTMEWFGVTSAQWAQMSLEQQRPYHEQWAVSFERWNLEGKAPTQGLQPIFSRFRAWLLSVYKSVEEFVRLNPGAGKLNDEVRGVFSRLLASAEAIEATEQARAYQPLYANANDAGVSEEAYQKYLDLGEDATTTAKDELQTRSLRDMKWLTNARNKALKAIQDTAKATRAKVYTEVLDTVSKEHIYQAMRFLRTGEMVDPNTGELIKAAKGYKLDTAMVKEMYPETALDNPDLTKLRGMTGPEGLAPDLVAQMFGMTSGDALIRELTSAENMREKVEGLTDQRMLEEHGDLVDERSMQRAADEAVHNEARARFMATGLKMLSKSPISVTQIAKAAKNAAETAIANKRVRDIKPKQYLAAETKANKNVIKALPKKPQEAVEQQRVALLNNRLASAAQEAVLEVDKALRYLGKFNNEGTRKNLDLDYLEQIDALLEPFDLRKGLSLRTIDARTTLAEWLANQEAMGFEPTIDPVAMAEARQKSYKNMTMAEMRALVDTIKQIEHMGRMKKKLLTAIERADFLERIADAKASIALNANRTVPERGTPTDTIGMVGQWVRQMFAAHRKFSSFMRELDGGQNNGVLFNLLIRPMAEASNNETEMKAQAAEALGALFEPIQKQMSSLGGLYAKRRVVPGTNISMTHEQRIMFAMNWGNEGNRQRLLDGGITGKKAMSQQEARAVLDTLTKEEWDFVQGVWDYISTYRPMIEAQERQLTGKTPGWVEPAQVETKFGTYPGGYFPAKYDGVLSTRSESLEAVSDLRAAMKGAFGSSSARNGYTKARAAEVKGRPLLLSFNAISRHTNEVIHRLAWQAWLVDANRVIRALDDDFRTYLGAEATKEIRDAVKDIAQGDAPATTPVEAAVNRVRTGTSIVGMGWSIATALLQPTGLSQSMARVGGRHMVRGLARFIANPNQASDWVNENSTLLRNRHRTMNREMNEILNTVRSGKQVSAITGSFFYLVGKLQRMVDVPTYIAGYERALEELQYELASSAEERARIEKQAHAIAAQTVIDTQGGGELKDLAKVQRGSPIFKLFTNFYSYMSTVYNLNVEAYRTANLKNPSEFATFVAEMLLINWVPVVLSTALHNVLKGSCEWDDMECLVNKYKSEQISHLFGQMVALRELGVSVDAVTGGEVFGYTGPAGLRWFADVYKAAQQTEQGEMDMAWFKAVNNVAGALFHYPAGQINRTVEGAIAIENGEVEGVAILPALVGGAPK